MRVWYIPIVYATAAILAGFLLPRAEHAYFETYMNAFSTDSALAFLGAIASGMMALTAIVFSIAYITVQFNAIAYSPRLALWFANDPRIFHSLGLFIATFLYALATMAWVGRGGTSGVPFVSGWIVLVLVIASTLSFVILVRGLSELQINNTLHFVGDKGRAVIAEMYPRIDDRPDAGRGTTADAAEYARIGPAVQTIRYFGKPRTIARFDIPDLVRRAEEAGAVFNIVCAVGDTLSNDTVLMTVHGTTKLLREPELRRAIHLKRERTFEQDPKYAFRLLVDIAIKALSPAINDPTTAVQALDQIEDLLRRIGRHELDAGYARDAGGRLRVVFPMPSWEDYLHLAFDEIRQYGSGSVQVMRRLRSALAGVAEAVASETRTAAVQAYLKQLDLSILRSPLDADDRAVASQEDRQGLGVSRKRPATSPPPARTAAPPQ
jgi:uncharacterized membrane protein